MDRFDEVYPLPVVRPAELPVVLRRRLWDLGTELVDGARHPGGSLLLTAGACALLSVGTGAATALGLLGSLVPARLRPAP